MGKDFINRKKMEQVLGDLFAGCIDDAERWESSIEDMAYHESQRIAEDMVQYVHMEDTSMAFCFANIREDWDVIPDFVKSEVKPWGKFDDIIKSIDEGTISDEDLERFQTWCADWFFDAFGTWGLCYNFQTYIGELEYEEEKELQEEVA